MKKIYYLQKELVKIGDVIEHNGFRATVTEELVKFNPELFLVKDIMQELLDKAKRDYPAGTRYISFNEHKISNKEDLPLVVSEIGIPYINHHEFDNTTICINSGKYNGVIYTDGKWAEILPLKFTTEDGVDIYGDMKTYAICKEELILELPSVYGGNSPTLIYFYHKENALAYIEKHREKEKTLRDYENTLFERGNLITSSAGVVYCSMIYGWLKYNELKLYYTKLLQLIAEDLNDGRYIHERGYPSFHINKEGRVTLHMGYDEGCVYFKSKELAEKARDILGSKLKYLFN